MDHSLKTSNQKPRIAVVQFPGNNCETETARAVEGAGMHAEIFRWNRPSDELAQFDGYVLGGGFAYEDRGRAGVIAAQDPLMKALRPEAAKGKPVLGICNGAQALVEAGFIPGVNGYQLGFALARNKRVKDNKVLGTGYYNSWVHVKHTSPTRRCAFTYAIPEKAMYAVPVAHGEGRYTTEDDALFHQLVANHQVVFRYCNSAGAIIDEFPTNPNGALYNIAAICNPAGNVMAIMPHPERGVIPPLADVFTSMKTYIESGMKAYECPLLENVIQLPRKQYQASEHAFEILVDLIITDNECYTLETALHDLGFTNVRLQRRTFWSVKHAKTKHPEALAEKVMRSGVLFNTNKEAALLRCVDRVCTFTLDEGLTTATETLPTFTCIVVDKEDSVGTSKFATLREHFALEEITSVRHGVYWSMHIEGPDPLATFQKVLDTHLFYNPHSQDCYTIGN